MAERRLPYSTLPVLLVFTAGVIFGTMVQKYYGFANILTTVGINDHASSAPILSPTRTPLGAEDDIPEEFRGMLSLFILAGQSNMSGRGELPSEQPVNSRVFVFGNDYRWRIAIEPIDAPTGQVDEVSIDRDAGFGPGLAFATSLLKQNPNMIIGLIPCAKGASSIEQWQRNLSDNTLYGSCLKRVRAATTMGEIAGLLFFQGETDALDPKQYPDRSPSAFEYATKFSTFVNDLRGEVLLPTLPVVFAQIGTNTAPEDYVNWHIVKEQQATIELSCSTMITTDDLSLRDEVHFTTKSYQIIGERFAEAFLNLIDLPPNCAIRELNANGEMR